MKRDIVKLFFDLETTGVEVNKNSIHQLSGIIEVNGNVVEEFNIKMRPHDRAIITEEAMRVCKTTEEEIKTYPPYKKQKDLFVSIVTKYIDRFDPKQKIYLVGFNNRYFDDVFLRKLFELCGDPMIGSIFWNNSIDVLCLATEYLIDQRHNMPSFKLLRVAKTLGIPIDKTKLHDAVYDCHLTRECYRIITGLEESLF